MSSIQMLDGSVARAGQGALMPPATRDPGSFGQFSHRPLGIHVERKRVIIDDDGGLDEQAILAAASALRDDVEGCYRVALNKSQNLMGPLDIALTIQETGKASTVGVSGFDAAVDKCVEVAATRRIFQSPPAGSATMQFSFACSNLR